MRQVEIKTANRTPVVAQVYGAEERVVLIIASATGVKQSFYQKFADFVSASSITVITFDYAGIGLSRPQPLKQVKSNAADWGRNDLEAVIQYAKASYPNANITLLGHSIGGQLIGLAKSATEVQKIILVAAQSGYWKLWRGMDRVKMWANWHLLFPILLAIFGYLPAKRISGMEDLPKNVAKQWSRWGRKPNYLFDEVTDPDLFFNNITVKVTAISLADDFYAPQAAVDFLTDKYQNAEEQKWHLRPADHGVKAIGHFGIFREKFQNTLWQLLLGEVAR